MSKVNYILSTTLAAAGFVKLYNYIIFYFILSLLLNSKMTIDTIVNSRELSVGIMIIIISKAILKLLSSRAKVEHMYN